MGGCTVLPQDGGAGLAEGGLQDGRGHPLHPQFPLLAGAALAPLLAVAVGDVGVLDLVLGQGPLEIVADEKARPVAVGEEDQPPLGPDPAQEGQGLLVPKDAKAGGFQDHRVHHLGEGVLVVPPLHHNGLSNLQHGAPPADSSSSRETKRSFPSAPVTDFMARSVSAHRRMAVLHQARSWWRAPSRSLSAG